MFPPFAAVLRPHPGDVHGGLLAVAGGAGAGSLHSHILQVLFGLKKKKKITIKGCFVILTKHWQAPQCLVVESK